MKRIVLIVAGLLLSIQLAGAQQVISATSASAESHADGLYYLVLTGDGAFIDRVCAYGNCAQGFPSRIGALNYWTGLMGQALNISIVPIPPPLMP